MERKYNKTPVIIKEVLGEEIYNQMEEVFQNSEPHRVIYIQCSKKIKELFEKEFKKEYEQHNKTNK